MNVECTEFKSIHEQFSFFQVMGSQLETRHRVLGISCILTYKQGYPNTKRESNSPPQPLSNYSFNNSGPIPDMGIYNTDRGHLVALEFGGPELTENLVPMWSRFNKHGDWKKLEAYIKTLISSHMQVAINIKCHYSHNSFEDSRIPLSFYIEVQWKDDSNNLYRTTHTLQHSRPYAERYISTNNIQSNIDRLQGLKLLAIRSGYFDTHGFTREYYKQSYKDLHCCDYPGGPYTIQDYALLIGEYKRIHGTSIKDRHPFTQNQREDILILNATMNEGFVKTDDPDDIVYHVETTSIKNRATGEYKFSKDGFYSEKNLGNGYLSIESGHQSPEIDHIFPESLGGCNAFANAQVISAEYNKIKSNNIDPFKIQNKKIERIRDRIKNQPKEDDDPDYVYNEHPNNL